MESSLGLERYEPLEERIRCSVEYRPSGSPVDLVRGDILALRLHAKGLELDDAPLREELYRSTCSCVTAI